MDVPRRTLQFIQLGDEITFVSLVCEDLAQMDELAAVIRSVGPTIVVAPLLDGPQLPSRWSARYASVLADDPGSAVMTITSYGMVRRCRPGGRDASAVIALWRDPVRGFREIPLEAGAQAVLLTLCTSRASRRTADGRSPVENVTTCYDVADCQVHASSESSGSFASPSSMSSPLLLECEELTVLTGWAEAVAEALVYAPQRVDDVLADAREGSAWRMDLGLSEPSLQLGKAFDAIAQAIRSATPNGGAATLDAVLASSPEDQRGQGGIDRLARQVLRSTLEQLCTRQAADAKLINVAKL
jgi:hypothetical protein